MNKEQLNIYHLIKEVINYAYNDNLEMKDFILYFYCSKHLEKIINYYEVIYYNPFNVYLALLKEHDFKQNIDLKQLDINVVNYICYIYLTFHFITDESFKMIVKQLTIDDILNYYEQYHTLADERVIFKSKIKYNEKNNAIRKMRSSGHQFDLSNNKKNLYIAKEIYLKLFEYNVVKSLKYQYLNKRSFLANNEATLFVSNYVNLSDTISDIDVSYLKFNHVNNILFVFLKEHENMSKEALEELFYAQTNIPFDQILVYKNEIIQFINKVDGYKEFNIALTNLDIKKIEKEYLEK